MTYFKRFLGAALLLLAMIAFLGLLYPALVWGISSLVSPWRAGGSLYTSCGKVISSDLISVYNESSPLFHPFPPNSTSSGVDPYIPLEEAMKQVERVSKETGIPREKLVDLLMSNAAYNDMIDLHVFSPGYSIVNVEEVNMQIMEMMNVTCGVR
ncbi:potassium-transporting ATPase subunit C [Fervidicoccus fontis]|nr:potassium-transporting ATPase subunit C [Fervidicoccus fontis]